MAGWHHRLDGCESEQALGVGDGQGGQSIGAPASASVLLMTIQD